MIKRKSTCDVAKSTQATVSRVQDATYYASNAPLLQRRYDVS